MSNKASKVHKSKELADEHRNRGNAFFKRAEFKKTLTAYNESLCAAPSCSKEVALAYGNRSAVYCETELYAECLENIDLARANGFPVEKMNQLDVREKKVKKLMKSEAGPDKFDPWSFFKLSHPANEKIPFIVNCLELRENEKYGRYIITSQELKTGDVIAIEEPFFAVFNEEYRFSHCSYCAKSNKLNLIPCAKCADAMYCSQECLKTDYAHQVLFCSLKCRFPNEEYIFVVSATLNFLRAAGGVNELIYLLSDNQSKTVFDFDLSNPEDKAYEKNLLISVNSLKKAVMEEKYQRIGSYMLDSLLIAKQSISADQTGCLEQILTNLYARIGINCFGLPLFESNERLVFGKGVFPFMSLVNHSCDPNIDYFFVDGKMVFGVRRPIKAREQIFVKYCSDFNMITRLERQQILEKNYEFVCDCNACVKDYPISIFSQRKDRRFVRPPIDFLPPQKAIAQYKKNCKYIEKNIKNNPSEELSFLMTHNESLLGELAAFKL